MEIEQVTYENIYDAGLVYSKSWKASHKDIVNNNFLISHTPERQSEYLKKEMNIHGNEVYILYDNKLPVGIISLNIYNTEIKLLYISPESWGKGYGKCLLDYGIDILKESRRIFLIVMNVNKRAIRFYENNGFVYSGKEKVLSYDKDISELEYVYYKRT